MIKGGYDDALYKSTFTCFTYSMLPLQILNQYFNTLNKSSANLKAR